MAITNMALQVQKENSMWIYTDTSMLYRTSSGIMNAGYRCKHTKYDMAITNMTLQVQKENSRWIYHFSDTQRSR